MFAENDNDKGDEQDEKKEVEAEAFEVGHEWNEFYRIGGGLGKFVRGLATGTRSCRSLNAKVERRGFRSFEDSAGMKRLFSRWDADAKLRPSVNREALRCSG